MLAAVLRARVLVVCILFFLLAGVTVGGAQGPVTTWHYDNARSGANSSETTLTPQNVNSKEFGKLFTQPVDGAVIGQALYLPGVTIPNAGVHNVVYVATMHDSVYAFDADTATGKNAHPLWHRSFLKNGTTPVPIALQKCGGVTLWTEVGIVSTPVIDPVAGTLYIVAKTYENSASVHRLHALDVATGREKTGSPIVITASYEFAGQNNIFQDAMQVNRPALLLENGNLYIAFGSNGCRNDKEQGWVVAYDAATLQPAGAFDVEPGESAAAIWQRGGGLSSDSEGNVYAATADGPFMAGTNFGQSVIKLSQSGSTLKLADWFTPFNEAYLDQWDLDMSEPVLVLPDQAGRHPHEAVAVGKRHDLHFEPRQNGALLRYVHRDGHADRARVDGLRSRARSAGLLEQRNLYFRHRRADRTPDSKQREIGDAAVRTIEERRLRTFASDLRKWNYLGRSVAAYRRISVCV